MLLERNLPSPEKVRKKSQGRDIRKEKTRLVSMVGLDLCPGDGYVGFGLKRVGTGKGRDSKQTKAGRGKVLGPKNMEIGEKKKKKRPTFR